MPAQRELIESFSSYRFSLSFPLLFAFQDSSAAELCPAVNPGLPFVIRAQQGQQTAPTTHRPRRLISARHSTRQKGTSFDGSFLANQARAVFIIMRFVLKPSNHAEIP